VPPGSSTPGEPTSSRFGSRSEVLFPSPAASYWLSLALPASPRSTLTVSSRALRVLARPRHPTDVNRRSHPLFALPASSKPSLLTKEPPYRRLRPRKAEAPLLRFAAPPALQALGARMPQEVMPTPWHRPPSGFDYPLDGLLHPKPCEPSFMPAALLGFVLDSHPCTDLSIDTRHAHPGSLSKAFSDSATDTRVTRTFLSCTSTSGSVSQTFPKESVETRLQPPVLQSLLVTEPAASLHGATVGATCLPEVFGRSATLAYAKRPLVSGLPLGRLLRVATKRSRPL
jgi:hypothetical protein